MKQSWFKPTEQILLTILAGFVFWPNAISSISLILLLILRLFQSRLNSLPNRNEWIHFIPVFLIFISWAVHGFAEDGGREIQLWLTWVAAFFYFKTSPYKQWFLKSFQWISVLQAVAVLSLIVFGKDLAADGYSYYLREYVEQTFKVHPTFLSTAWLWASFFFVNDLKSLNWKNVIPSVFLIGLAIMMGGKMPLLAFVAIGCFFVLNHIQETFWKIVSVLSMVTLLVCASLFSPVLSERANEIRNINLDFENSSFVSSTDLRIGIWKCAWESTSENWLIGVGLGNTRAALDACYEQYNHPVFFEGEYNAHNQFLHVWLSGGILILLAFLGYWLFLLIEATKQKDKRFLYFVLFFLICCMTENYLSRQFGMMFAAFMIFGLIETEEEDIVSKSSVIDPHGFEYH